MNEKKLAMIGVVILAIVATIGMVLAHDAATVTQVALSGGSFAGVIVTLWKLGSNTEKTEEVARSVNGLTDQRVAAAYKEAYARGRVDGATEEHERMSKALATKTTAEVAAATLVAAAAGATNVAVAPQDKISGEAR